MVGPEARRLGVPPHLANMTSVSHMFSDGELKPTRPKKNVHSTWRDKANSQVFSSNHSRTNVLSWILCELQGLMSLILTDKDLINETNGFQLHTSSLKHIRGELAEKLTIW